MELKLLCEKVKVVFKIETIHELSNKLLDVCINNQHEYIKRFCDLVGDLSVDWMQKIFQYYEADRKEKKQDYTPSSLARFICKLTESTEGSTVYDLCAGSGALSIQKWNIDHSLSFVCYEYDEKVIPLLLFNLASRNINAIVIHGDALQDEVYTMYEVRRGDQFGTITKITTLPSTTADVCISNPPYNMKWKLPPFAQIQSRFSDCELPPESNANYAFVLTALNNCKNKAVMILPNGILSTENTQERAIRRYLIEKNLIEAVILCPDAMFEATSIPTCIIVLNKHKTTTHIAFVDMRQTYDIQEREQNGQFGGASHEKRTYKKAIKVFSDEQMQMAIDAIAQQSAIPGFSKSVSLTSVVENDFSLMASRYIDSQEQEVKHREYGEIIDDLNRIIREKNSLKLTVNETLAKQLGLYETIISIQDSTTNNKSMNEMLSFTGKKLEREDYASLSKKAGELRFENGSKTSISTILLSILQMWRQHIMYLNNEENRYLAELRDALLPDLMSGRIVTGLPEVKDE